MNSVGNIVGLLIFAVILIGIFMPIRNFWLWNWGISAIQQLLRDQLAATRELHESVTVTNSLLSYVCR